MEIKESTESPCTQVMRTRTCIYQWWWIIEWLSLALLNLGLKNISGVFICLMRLWYLFTLSFWVYWAFSYQKSISLFIFCFPKMLHIIIIQSWWTAVSWLGAFGWTWRAELGKQGCCGTVPSIPAGILATPAHAGPWGVLGAAALGQSRGWQEGLKCISAAMATCKSLSCLFILILNELMK